MQQEYWACPHCAHQGPTHTFKLMGQFVPGWRDASRRRRCPACGRTALPQDFRRLQGRPQPLGRPLDEPAGR